MVSFIQNYSFIILAILAGMMMPTQAAINNKLASHVESPILSAFISFAVGTLALFLYILATGIPLSNLANAKNAPAVAWLGGILGAFFVASAVVLVPKIGVALTFSLIIAGQMLVTLVIDHFGWLGVPERPVSVLRVVGAAMITIGVVLIRRF
ncbi:MAG: DMT family transporter [Acidobacteria bacterium]|nr:DMT family transporter [Acidobacteriota bacterium]MBK8812399.1 DMT family transporter [Acidobacteriota bacterium]